MIASYILSRTLVPTLVHAADGARMPHGTRRRADAQALRSASTAASTASSSACARGYTPLLASLLDAARTAFALGFLGFCVAVVPALPVARPRLLPERRRRPDPAAHARADRHAHRGDRAHRRRGRESRSASSSRRTSSRPSSTTSACRTAASTSPYSNAGTIGTLDGEILMSLNEGPPADRGVRDAAARASCRSASRASSSSSSRPTSSRRSSTSACPRRSTCSSPAEHGREPRPSRSRLLARSCKQIPGAVDVHVHQAFAAAPAATSM